MQLRRNMLYLGAKYFLLLSMPLQAALQCWVVLYCHNTELYCDFQHLFFQSVAEDVHFLHIDYFFSLNIVIPHALRNTASLLVYKLQHFLFLYTKLLLYNSPSDQF